MAGEGEELLGKYLCTVDFHVEGGIFALGETPWGSRRIGYISGGSFHGPALTGTVLPGGGNWSAPGRLATGATVGTFDARAVWRTDDGALIYVTYTGRSVIPEDVQVAFADPERANHVAPSRYYLRIAPVFETASPAYTWLNGVLAVGKGERTERGARHRLFTIA